MSSVLGIEKRRRTLRLGVLSGVGWAGMAGLTQNYITPFALELKASAFQIGLLTSVPNITMALSQLFTPNLTQRMGSRKRTTLMAIFIDALTWLPIMLIPFIFKQQAVWFLLMFFAIKGIGGNLGSPAWSSMMAELVPQGVRGRYFSWRGTLVNGAMLIFSFIAMGIMEYFKTRDIFVGFSILFGGAALFRLLSAVLFSRMYEPPMSREEKAGSIWRTVLLLGSTDFGRFTIVMSVFMFALNLGAPFYAVFLYRDLKFDFLPYIVVMTAGSAFMVVFAPFWGRRSERVGNAKIIRLVLLATPIGPILWLFSSNVAYLVAIQVMNAFFGAGLNLAMNNYIMDEARREEVTRNMAIFNTFFGAAACLGALIGGVLASRLPPVFGYSLKTLFLLQGALLFAVAAIGYRRIREVRQVARTSMVNLLLGKFPGPTEKRSARSDYGFRILPEMSDEELSDKNGKNERRPQ